MKVIARARQGGKTWTLLQWARDAEPIPEFPFWTRIILSHNQREAARLRTSGVVDPGQVFSIGEWRAAPGRGMTSLPVHIAVDNVDLVLQELLQAVPSVVTLTREAKRGD